MNGEDTEEIEWEDLPQEVKDFKSEVCHVINAHCGTVPLELMVSVTANIIGHLMGKFHTEGVDTPGYVDVILTNVEIGRKNSIETDIKQSGGLQ